MRQGLLLRTNNAVIQSTHQFIRYTLFIIYQHYVVYENTIFLLLFILFVSLNKSLCNMDVTVHASVHDRTLFAAIFEVQPAADLQTWVNMHDEQTKLKADSP